ncbi:MAG: right-handed parallel beta-helix repeat-containing protein [Bacteroidales bacterium]|nr:right-handed parallel beta-helix repeat-containing protein [Bacteroidales bacterium]
MRTSVKYLLLAAALLAALSCNKEKDIKDIQTPDTAFETVPYTFLATQEDNSTKTTLEGDQSVSWAVDDAVKFIYELDGVGGTAISSALEAEDISAGSANFTVSLPAAFKKTEEEYKEEGGTSLHLYAVYPSSSVVDPYSGGEFILTVPTEQDGSFANAAITLAKWNKANPSAALVFKNICGILQFTVSDASVRKVVFSSGGATIAGRVSVSFGDEGPSVKSVKSGATSITVNVPGAGTYYLAVLPSTMEELDVELYDAFDILVGNKVATASLSIERRQLCSVGTLPTGFASRFYVKADGTGDGSSWDSAASYADLATVFASNTTKQIYLAAGEYTATQIAPGTGITSAKMTILGGYPSDASGHCLSGRNVTANEVVLNANSANRIWVLQRGKWYIDGITFKNATRAGSDTGSALVIEGNASASFIVKNCKFTGNANTGTVGGGAVRVSGSTVKMYGCSFSENTSAKDGAAIYVNSTGTLLLDHCTFTSNASSQHGGAIAVATGSLTAVNCDFESNTAATSAGTIYIKGSGTAKFNLCTFRSNVANGTANTNGGGVAWVTETGKLYMNRCFMANNQDQYNAHAIYSGTSSWVGISNCVIRGPFAVTKTQGSVLQIKGSNVIVNSTLYSQTGSWGTISLGSKTENGCRVINSIVINNASSQRSFHCTSYYIQAYNSIYSVANNATSGYGVTDPESSCISGASARSGGNFPTSALEWGYNGAIKNGERFDLDGDRYIYVYPWEGTTDAGTVVYNSLSGIKTLIGGTANIGTDFLSWLESDDLKVGTLEALAMDIRGKARNTSAMWPGSYEETATKASIQNFNVK